MMELFQNIQMGMDMLLQWDVVFSAAGGVMMGLLMGAIPGLSDIIAICLMVPFTFYLSPIAGIAMLMGLSKGANFGEPSRPSFSTSGNAPGCHHRL